MGELAPLPSSSSDEVAAAVAPPPDAADAAKEKGALIADVKKRRKLLRRELKAAFNRTFGSSLRTVGNATLFSYELQRYATVYMSRVTNFLQYPSDHHFYPPETPMPHEVMEEDDDELE